MANIKFASTTALPTEQQMQVMELQRQQAMADALRQQALETPAGGGMVGNIYVAPSWTQGLAQLGKAYLGSQADTKVKDELRTLAKRNEDESNATIARLRAASEGLPAAFNSEAPAVPSWAGQQAGPTPATGAARQRMMIDALIGSGNPEMRNAGVSALLSSMTKDPMSMFAKVDLSKVDPKSVPEFIRTNDPSSLRFKEELVTDNLGNEVRYRTKYDPNPVATANINVSPDTQARINWNLWAHNNPSAAERANIGLRAQEVGNSTANTFYNTGMVPGAAGFSLPPVQPQQMGAPSPMAAPSGVPPVRQPGTPMSAPPLQQPVPAQALPPGVPANLPPKVRDQILADQAKRDSEKKAEMPQANASVGAALQNLDRLAEMSADLSRAPGLKNILGPVSQYQFTDGFEETRDARALANAVKNQVGTIVLQAMRDASKTGGAVGNVTEKEWPILQQNLAALDLAQSPRGYLNALTNLQSQLDGMRSRISKAYEQQYGAQPNYERVPYSPLYPLAKPAGNPEIESLLNKYGGKR